MSHYKQKNAIKRLCHLEKRELCQISMILSNLVSYDRPWQAPRYHNWILLCLLQTVTQWRLRYLLKQVDLISSHNRYIGVKLKTGTWGGARLQRFFNQNIDALLDIDSRTFVKRKCVTFLNLGHNLFKIGKYNNFPYHCQQFERKIIVSKKSDSCA